MDIEAATKTIITSYDIDDWFAKYPWLTGWLGDAAAPIWFVGENPSLSGVESIDRRSPVKSPNLQWNSSAGDQLFREALGEAGLKQGLPPDDSGWRCYITNAIKEPEVVAERNAKKSKSAYWKEQADRWAPLLQDQIDTGAPKVLVALGGQTEKILKYMIRGGLNVPRLIKIHHYSYIMLRPEAGTRRGPRHPDRIAEFKRSIREISNEYYG